MPRMGYMRSCVPFAPCDSPRLQAERTITPGTTDPAVCSLVCATLSLAEAPASKSSASWTNSNTEATGRPHRSQP
jgi:hypothetical protein